MQIASVLKSASFRLSAAYAILFSVSVGVLAAVIYWVATTELDHQLRTRVQAESSALRSEFIAGGKRGLLQAINQRQRGRLVGGLDYGLFDSAGGRVFGTTPAVRCTRGLSTINGPPDGDEPNGQMEQLLVSVTPLPQGFCLIVGDDIGKVHRMGALILKSFGWVFALSLSLAIGGGIFLSSQVWQRIETIIGTAEEIIQGNMARRIPRRSVPDDLDRLAATLNRMLDRITNLMEGIRHVSNDVAHDLRTPLGRLRHQLEEARERALTPEEYRKTIDDAVAEVDEILATFSAILRIAQIESGTRRAAFEKVCLTDLVDDVCELYLPSFEDQGKSLIVRSQRDLIIRGDRDLIAQSIANLLENAIRHTPQGTTVVVTAEQDDVSVDLVVADNGSGVPAGEHPRILERFYRVDNSRNVSGNGLGLSIVAAVAELHGADLSVRDNHPGLCVELKFSPMAVAA